MKAIFKSLVRSFGIDIVRYKPASQQQFPRPYLKRRMLLISTLQIDTVFDVGANIGQYALSLRRLGYKNRIISFEPLSVAFGQLKQKAADDPDWITCNFALGDRDMKSTINVSDNTYSSSLLDILPSHTESEPASRYVSKEEIAVKRLDSVFADYCKQGNRVMLKIDTQGYEKNVLEGAAASLPGISLIQLEMSLIPLYRGEITIKDMLAYLEAKGFYLVSLEDGFYDENTGQQLQVDGLFVNSRHLDETTHKIKPAV